MNPHKEAVRAAVKLAKAATPGPWVATDETVGINGNAFWITTGNPTAGDSSNDTYFIEAAHQHVTLIQQLSDSLDAEIAARAADNAAKDAEIDHLAEVLHSINRTLSVPAAEYVPAIRDAFTLIDSAFAIIRSFKKLTTGDAK